MHKLERFSLGEVVDVRDGTHDSPKYVEGGFPLITSKNLIEGKVDFENVNFITEVDYNSINKRSKVDKGDILYSMIGSIGNLAIVNFEPRFAIKNVALFKFKNSNLSSKYFIHFIKSNEFTSQIEKQSKGGTQKFVTLKILRNIQVPLPPIEEQQKIANILDTADELRQNDKAMIAKYDELTQALFLDMFGDPVSNPKSWKKVELSDFINKLNTGVSVNSEDTTYENGQFFILKTSCVYSGIFDPMQVKVIREDEVQRAKLNPKKDSIIISRMNTSELVGKSAYIFNDYPNIFLPDRLWQTEKTNLEHSVLWLSYNIGHKSFMNEISKISSGTSGSMKNISKSSFLKLKSIAPPLELQNQFAERVALIEEQKAIAQKNLEKSEELFNTLLQKAFKGELI